MKKSLTRTPNKTYYYEDSERIEGVPKDISGNLDDCDITDEEREKGISINELIKE